MAKDNLGLEWKDKDSDEPLYNALIWALGIGIVIVIATLIITRPAPESFTELYFNNHTSLPEYITLNTIYPYSFSIHNLENMNHTYNYTVLTEYYQLDYSCETPELWVNTETNDPALYIKESNYTIGFDYELKRGNNISLSLVSPDGKPIYILYIQNDRLTLNSQVFNISKAEGIHRFQMSADSTYIKIVLDSKTYRFKAPEEYTHGYLYIQTYDTYAEFTNAYIQKSIRYPIYIRLPDAVYQEQIVFNTTGRYYTEIPVNLTNYTVKATFRLNAVSLDLRENTRITYDNATLTVTDNNNTETFTVIPKSVNDITTKVTGDSIHIYYNNEYITSISNTNATITPQITYTNETINDFYVKSDDTPITVVYNIPEQKEVTSRLLTLDTLRYMIEPQNNTITFRNISGYNTTEDIQNFIEKEKVKTDNYRITLTYVDRNGVMNLAIKDLENDIYSVTIANNMATVSYHNSTLQTYTTNVTMLNTNKVYIDANNGTLSVYLNNQRIFSQKALTSNGILVFDYKNITITDAQLQDRNTGKIITYRKQQSECEPILVNSQIYNSTATIPDGGIGTILNAASFIQPFDMAKVQITLENGQEIHYWVKLK